MDLKVPLIFLKDNRNYGIVLTGRSAPHAIL